LSTNMNCVVIEIFFFWKIEVCYIEEFFCK
jgi:hypothetical protein